MIIWNFGIQRNFVNHLDNVPYVIVDEKRPGMLKRITKI